MPILITVNNTTHHFRTIREMVAHHDYDRVTKIIITHKNVAELPALPESLTELYCRGNQLTSLPALPASLIWLSCGYNQLKSLPELPASLTELNCYNNQLTSLPALPESLTKLNCSFNQLMSLPALPASLTLLDCYDNQLTSLPALPASLIGILYGGNEVELTLRQVNQLNAIRERRAIRSEHHTVYGDSQNVHASSVSASLLRSVEALMK
jgi:Leucine-rich repeat (LRR) protein